MKRWFVSYICRPECRLLCFTMLCLVISHTYAQDFGGLERDGQEPGRSDRSPERLDIPAPNNLLGTEARESTSLISRREAYSIVSDAYQGRVLSIRQDNNQWRVRMDQDGTVFNVFVDSKSGKLSRPAE